MYPKTNVSLIILLFTFSVGISCYSQDFDSHNTSKISSYTSNYNLSGYVSTGAILTNRDYVPFWMRTNDYGGKPLSGLSSNTEIGIYKRIENTNDNKLFKWGAGIDAMVNLGNESNIYILEAYLKAQLGKIQISAGRNKEIIGLVDSTLSTGAFSISGNALGIPKVEISLPAYWDIPFTKGIVSVKGNLAHGWLGERVIYPTNEKFQTYLHQKSFYGRVGKANWLIRLYGGFNHQVMWGNERDIYEGLEYGLSNLESFRYVFTGKAYGTADVPTSKVGNHLGSIDQGLEINMKRINIFAYHQFFYEAGALAKLANIKDGVFGVSLTNKKNIRDRFTWNKGLIEVTTSKSQGGEIDSPVRPSAKEEYYNNWQYVEGWTYNGENIGIPLFTSHKYLRDDLPAPEMYIVNNRVYALNLGLNFKIDSWNIITKTTFSNNFGNYLNSPAHRGLGEQIVYHDPPYFGEVFQFSGYLEVSKKIKNGFYLNLAFANDSGGVLYNSNGGYVKVIRKW